MRKPRANEQEPHRRPVGPGELAHHSEAVRFGPGGKWGGCVAEDCALTWGDLPGAIPAEVSRSRSSRRNEPGAGRRPFKLGNRRTHPMKGRTDEGDSDRRRDVAAVTASRRGGSESLSDGKHGNLQGGLSSLFSLRALCPGLVGTAGYGPVRPVVWDPWLAGLALSQSRGPDSLL
jgi:hypothetical protein